MMRSQSLERRERSKEVIPRRLLPKQTPPPSYHSSIPTLPPIDKRGYMVKLQNQRKDLVGVLSFPINGLFYNKVSLNRRDNKNRKTN